jgi:TetR/AcrR family transcriptional regulator, regulator of biofilm formation and stress response
MTTMTSRRPKGERRRHALLEATLQLIGRGGPAAVTHRALAAEAGVPLATTTYYFSSKTELLREALRLAVREDVALAESDPAWREARDAGTAAELADALARNLGMYLRDPERAVAHHEVFLAASRDPELAPTAEEWTATNTAMLEPLLDRLGSDAPADDARIVNAILNGLTIEQLGSPVDDFTERVAHPALRRTLEALLPDPDQEAR